VVRYSKGERPDYPPLLVNYFNPKARAILDEHRERVMAAHAQGKIFPEFPELLISASLDNTWHDTAEAVIDNWVGKVYQITNHDRKLPFQRHIDPDDPLGLKPR
jgi:homoserine O-succinyltransferase